MHGLTWFQESLYSCTQYYSMLVNVILLGYIVWFVKMLPYVASPAKCKNDLNSFDAFILITIMLIFSNEKEEVYENLSNTEQTDTMADGMIKTRYDPKTFTNMKECAICMVEFSKDS